jgi:hypothetical protein
MIHEILWFQEEVQGVQWLSLKSAITCAEQKQQHGEAGDGNNAPLSVAPDGLFAAKM